MTRLAAAGFVQSFRDKGRLDTLLASIPVDVARDPRTPLLGAASVALSLL